MVKYYLVPFETDSEKMSCDFQPKYVQELRGNVSGLQPVITKKNGARAIAWTQEYYVLKVELKTDQILLESKPDVILINRGTSTVKIAALGVDTKDITGVGYESRDRAITKWLVNGEKTFSEILK